MLKITVFLEVKESKDGVSFVSPVIKGKYLPLIEADQDAYYSVRLVKAGDVKEFPLRNGIYDLGYENRGDIWIDQRTDKNHILRIKCKKYVRVGDLPTKD